MAISLRGFMEPSVDSRPHDGINKSDDRIGHTNANVRDSDSSLATCVIPYRVTARADQLFARKFRPSCGIRFPL
jgi:hypothetical protein